MASLKRLGQAVLFAAVERLIHTEARRFFSRHRLIDLDDLVSEGQYTFLLCYDSYDEADKTRFETWFKRRLVGSFYDLLRKERRRAGPSIDLDAIPVEVNWSDMPPKREVSGDAAVVFAAFDKLRLTGNDATPARAAAILRRAVRKALGTRRRADRAWAAAESIIQGGAV